VNISGVRTNQELQSFKANIIMTNSRYLLLFALFVGISSAFGTHSAPTTSTSSKRFAPISRSKQTHPQPPRSSQSRLVQLVASDSLEGGGAFYSSSESTKFFPKTAKDIQFIREALLDNVMFTNLPKETLEMLIRAFEKTFVTRDQAIVTQGDSVEGDYVYMVARGECTVFVDGKVVPEPYGTLKARAIFGEMGVLYNQTRAATVQSKSDSVALFRVNGDTFKSVLNQLTLSFEDDPQLMDKIDQAINQVSGTKSLYGGDIISTFKSPRLWLWGRWEGTILQHNCKTVALTMTVSLIFILITRRITDPTWSIGFAPDKSHPYIARLEIIRRLWSYQMSLTTFILTFFLNQAYAFWQEVLGIARRIQGRLNDFHLLIATSCRRNPDGSLTRESEQLMDDVGATSRLFHALFWASCARRFSVLRTPKGMERMATRGLMTSRQLRVLQQLDVPDNQKHNACLEWMMIRAWQGIDDGTLRDDASFSQRLLDQMCTLRATYATIGDKLSCRMPLPYTHFVQILVDGFIFLSPFALYADLGVFSIFGVGVLTLFYTGLLDRTFCSWCTVM